MGEGSDFDMKGRLLGGYRIVGQLGSGGMGSVYKARDESLDRFVALKILSPALEADGTCIARFVREAKSIAAISHPNLMHIYSVGEEKGLHYFAMEFIDGVPLSKYLENRGKLGLEDSLRLIGQVLYALHKAHGSDIVHRDLKPGNIMLDGSGRAVLVDFGLSKDTTANIDLTGAGAIMGTPDYMAPEQIEGDPVGPQTDLYALGVMFFEMLTGIRPFRRKSAVLTMRAHCEEQPPALEEHRPDLPRLLGAILKKAMARNPGKRYRSAARMAADLCRVQATPLLQELAADIAAESGAQTVLTPAQGMPVSAPGMPTPATRLSVGPAPATRSVSGTTAKTQLQTASRTKSPMRKTTGHRRVVPAAPVRSAKFYALAATGGIIVGIVAAVVIVKLGSLLRGNPSQAQAAVVAAPQPPPPPPATVVVPGPVPNKTVAPPPAPVRHGHGKPLRSYQAVIRKIGGETLRGLVLFADANNTTLRLRRENREVTIPNSEIDIIMPLQEPEGE